MRWDLLNRSCYPARHNEFIVTDDLRSARLWKNIPKSPFYSYIYIYIFPLVCVMNPWSWDCYQLSQQRKMTGKKNKVLHVKRTHTHTLKDLSPLSCKLACLLIWGCFIISMSMNASPSRNLWETGPLGKAQLLKTPTENLKAKSSQSSKKWQRGEMEGMLCHHSC